MADRSDQDSRTPPATGDPDRPPRSDPDGGAPGGDPSEMLLERGPLEPGSPSPENVAFVLLGASGAVLLLLTVAL